MSATETPRSVPARRQQAAAPGCALRCGRCGAVVFLVVQAVRRWDVLLVTRRVAGGCWWSPPGSRSRGAGSTRAGRRWRSGVVSLVVFAVVDGGQRERAGARRRRWRWPPRRRWRPARPAHSPRTSHVRARARPQRPAAGAPGADHEPRGPAAGKAERFELGRAVPGARHRAGRPHTRVDLLQLAEDAVGSGAPTSSAWPVVTARRRSWPRWPAGTGSRSSSCRPAPATTSPSTSGSTARTWSARSTPSTDGVDRRIDLAEVNGRVFVNNASMGVYAKIVQSAEYRDAKMQTAADDAARPARARTRRRSTCGSPSRRASEATTAQLVLVSNNPYQLVAAARRRAPGPDLDERPCSGVVSVLVRGAAGRGEARGAAGRRAGAAGSRDGTSGPPPSSRSRSGGPVEVGVDGEALTLEPPLRFVIRPGALTVRLPRAALSRPHAPTCVHISFRDTWPPCGVPRWDARRSRPMTATGRDDPGEPVEERARRAAEPAHAPRAGARTGGGLLRRLGQADRAAYEAVARLSTPVLDVPLRRLSSFANHSKPWFLVAGALVGWSAGHRAEGSAHRRRGHRRCPRSS